MAGVPASYPNLPAQFTQPTPGRNTQGDVVAIQNQKVADPAVISKAILALQHSLDGHKGDIDAIESFLVALNLFFTVSGFTGTFTIGNGSAVFTNGVLTSTTAISGYSGTIMTAKLTGGGTNGSMVFVGGVLASQVAAT